MVRDLCARRCGQGPLCQLVGQGLLCQALWSGSALPEALFRNRVNVTIEDVQWLVLPKLMAVASDIFAVVQRRKASRDHSPEKAPPAKKAKGGLRQRDPW